MDAAVRLDDLLACYRLVLYRAVPAMPPLLAEQTAR